MSLTPGYSVFSLDAVVLNKGFPRYLDGWIPQSPTSVGQQTSIQSLVAYTPYQLAERRNKNFKKIQVITECLCLIDKGDRVLVFLLRAKMLPKPEVAPIPDVKSGA